MLFKILNFLRIVYATLIAAPICLTFTVVMMVIGLPIMILQLKGIFRVLKGFWTHTMFIILTRPLHLYGKENREKGKSYLVVGNHSSLMDIPAIMAVMPDIKWVAKESLFKIPFFGWFIKNMGCISINAKNLGNFKSAITQATSQAQDNVTIGIFPEGTRTSDGEIHNFKRGFIQILRNSNLDVLPITMNGFYKLKPKTHLYVNPEQKLEIFVHPPLKNEELRKMTDDEILQLTKSLVEKDYKLRPLRGV